MIALGFIAFTIRRTQYVHMLITWIMVLPCVVNMVLLG